METNNPPFIIFLTGVCCQRMSCLMNEIAASKSKEIFSEIGQRIKNLRQDKGYSLNELSKKTGFAKSYLSQIENLRREPSISALSQIAYVLEVDLLFLISGEFREPVNDSVTIVKKDERKTTLRPIGDSEYRYEALTYKKTDRLMEGYIVSIGPEFPSEPFIHEGQEMIYILEGSLELVYDGKSYASEKGDCIYLDSNKPHLFRSLNEKLTKVFAVFTARKN